MKLKKQIYIATLLASIALLTACNDGIAPSYTVGEENNTIVLGAGIGEGGVDVATRAVTEYGDHAKHVGFAADTKIALRVDGAWTGHSPAEVRQKTVATLGADDNKHNPLSEYTPKIYWDDYGTADPANTTGRDQGLTIYGAAVNGKTTLPTTLSGLDNTQSTWQSLAWKVGKTTETTVMDQSGGWSDYDLLTSNNVTVAKDNTYKFDNLGGGKLLEFTHAMSKITVELTAGEGFPRTDANDANTSHFENAPTVTLKGFYYTGTVNVEAKTSVPTTTSTADIKMKLSDGGTAHKATFDAMVFPGKDFLDTDEILSFTADGNTLKVTAAKLNAAIRNAIDNHSSNGYPIGESDLSSTPKVYDTKLCQSWNYKLRIIVNKTDLIIQATIVEWNEVEADKETPVINVTSRYGYTTAEGGSNVTDFTKDYDLFRSTTKETGYDEDRNTAGIQYAARYTSSTSSWDKTIYWPDHQTHYFFRGVYPKVGTTASGTTLADEAVTTENGKDVIAVSNATYGADTYPSDLAIAIPRKVGTNDTFDETCKNAGHTATPGICATEGTVYMNFEYVMSKVQFSLKSSNTTDPDYVDLTNAVVEIIDGNKSGKIRLSDGKHEDFVSGDKGKYILHATTPETGFTITTLDAIIPQTLGNDVKVRITIKDGSDNVLDVYEAQLNEIKDSSSAKITEWKPGNYYKYELTLSKTAITVTATLKDWVTVTAGDDVWF